MIDSWLESYQDPLFWRSGVGSFCVSMLAFAVFATPLTLLAALDPVRFRPYRIQNRRPRAQALLWPSIRSWLVNNAVMIAIVVVAWPLGLRHATVRDGAWPPWWEVAWQVVFFVYLDDLLYYGFHRAMHGRWLFKHVHGWHHRILTPWAVTGHYMHPFEYVMTGSIALVGPLLVGAHVVTVWVWLTLRQWEAAEGHCGYDLPWSPTHLLPLSDGAVHHDVHHARVKGNYAGFLSYLDGVFGTYARGYAAELRARHWAPFA